MRSVCGYAFVGVICTALPMRAGDEAVNAFDRVQAGLASFAKGDFAAADADFAAAQKAKPDDPRIAFDRGCAAAAKGEYEQALEHFRSVADGPDRKLALAAHGNMAATLIARMQKEVGDKPDEADTATRDRVRALARTAGKHYREAIAIDSESTNAKTKLENLKLWQIDMEARWQRADRRRALEKLGPWELLDHFEKEQRTLRSEARAAVGNVGSPALVTRQTEMITDLPILESKLLQLLETPQKPGKQADNAVDANLTSLRSSLSAAIGEIAAAMKTAAEAADKSAPLAVEPMGRCIKELVALDWSMRPFPETLAKSILRQESLLKVSQAQRKKNDVQIDPVERADEQNWLAGAANSLGEQAKAGLAMTNQDVPTDKGVPTRPGPQKNPLGEFVPAFRAAVERAPTIAELAGNASKEVASSRFAKAEPLQQKTLALLREIEKLLPKPPQQNNEQQNKDKDKNKNEQNNSDQQSQDSKSDTQGQPENKDSNKNPAKDEKNSQPKDAKSSNDKKKQGDGKEKKNAKSNLSDRNENPDEQSSEDKADANNTKQKATQKQFDPTRVRVELLSQQVRERDRKHKEAKERYERLAPSRSKVDKDW